MKAALLAKHPARAGGRYEIYVCTLSEPTYAAEIWSLLDPAAQLIEDQSKRIVCVPPSQKKSLATTLVGRAPQHLAVIVDDRPGIWVDEDRKQLLPVAAFHPYRRSVLHKETTIASLERIAEVSEGRESVSSPPALEGSAALRTSGQVLGFSRRGE